MCQIRAGGGCVREGGNCLKYLKGSGTEEGRGNKDFKNGGGGGAGSRGGCLKKRGIGTPLQTITKEKLKKQIENVTEPAKKIFGIVLYCST